MDLLTDPGVAIGATIAVPLWARAVIAWYVQVRVWGILPGLTRGMLRRNDFPNPNNWLVESVVALAVFLFGRIAGPWLAVVLELPSSPVWTVVYLVVTVPAVIWIFRRLKADDRRALRVRLQRQAQDSLVRFEDEAAQGHLW